MYVTKSNDKSEIIKIEFKESKIASAVENDMRLHMTQGLCNCVKWLEATANLKQTSVLSGARSYKSN